MTVLTMTESLKRRVATLACASLALIGSTIASASAAMIDLPPLPGRPSMVITVSGGCGPYGWRGPGGYCHFRPYYGPVYGGPLGTEAVHGRTAARLAFGAGPGAIAATHHTTAGFMAAAGDCQRRSSAHRPSG
jgi:hypothetical protein